MGVPFSPLHFIFKPYKKGSGLNKREMINTQSI